MAVLLLCAFPLIFMIVAHFVWPKKVTLPEIAVGAVVSVALAFGMYSFGKYQAMTFTEYWNGDVVQTYHRSIEYDRSYESCDSDGRNCRTVEVTGRDMNWYVEVDFGPDGDPFTRSWSVRYVNCSSTSRMICAGRYPADPAWAALQPGDPATMPNDYLNYVRAADYSLFNLDPTGYDGELPAYPTNIHSHVELDRVILDGVALPGGESLEQWNDALAEILMELGPNRQANMVMVLTAASNPSYADALIAEWDGANKNDIVIVAGFPSDVSRSGTMPAWVDVHSWAQNDIMNVTMRDMLLDNPDWWASSATLFPNVEQIVLDEFVRRPMAEFEYLRNEIEPSTPMLVFLTVLSMLIGAGLVYLFLRYDVFNGFREERF